MNHNKEVMKIYNISTSALFTLFGLFGNTIVIFILTRRKFLRETTFRFLIVSTIGGSMKLLLTWPITFLDSNATDDYTCKLASYFGFLIGRFTPWMNGLSSLDRYISVKYPQKFKFRNQFKCQALAVLILLTTLILIDLPFYFYVGKPINQTVCSPINYEAGIVLDILYVLLTILIPVTISLVTTYLTSKHLIEHKRRLYIVNFRREKQFFFILLGINTLFIMSQTPFIVLIVVCCVLKTDFFGTMAYYIVYSLTNVYVSFDIIIYFISNKLFRKECLFLIGFYSKKKIKSEIIELTENYRVKLTHYKKFNFF